MQFKYPITASYVRNWTLRDAIREIVSNGIDSEAQYGAEFIARHDAKKSVLHLINRNCKVGLDALYFGGSSKQEDSRLIGQYGEGLKLALLVFARQNVKLIIRNSDETWIPAFQKDELGTEILTISVRKGVAENKDFHIEIQDINTESWHAIQDMFLHLRKPAKVENTLSGQIIYDQEFTGRVFVKGVFVTKLAHFTHGYNFLNLDIGRDRRVPDTYDLNYQVASLWKEICHNDEIKTQNLYTLLKEEGTESSAFRYATLPESLSTRLAAEFKKEFGEDALPVSSIAEASSLEHYGKKGVVTPAALTNVLGSHFPTKEQVKQNYRASVVQIVQLSDLTPKEKDVLFQGLAVGEKVTGRTLGDVLSIVVFKDNSVHGVHTGSGSIKIARDQLSSLGKFLVTLFHEYAHEFAEDGAKGHIDRIQVYLEKAIDYLMVDA